MNETHNPDVLSCLANLSNDEVFTPPSVVNQMLDMLPQELFRSGKTTFLDIGCKSGVFLREITKRLITGLADEMPDLQTRVDHILHNQVFGIATTELTSLVSRRTLYCSKYPNCRYSASQFKTVEGNIRFRNIQHTFVNGRCKWCGASEDQFGTKARKGLETHAYEFIHTDHPEEIFKMKFDVIVGNPPYQLADGGGGGGSSASPLYHIFVEKAKALQPRHLVMIIPSRWFTGGKGLNEFRDGMLADRQIVELHDFPDEKDVFPGVEIKGGVCYFHWMKGADRPAKIVQHMKDEMSYAERYMIENGIGVYVRFNRAVEIVRKVALHNEQTFRNFVSTRKPFGLDSKFRGGITGNVLVYQNKSTAKIDQSLIMQNEKLIDKWKVLVSFAYGAGSDFPHQIIGRPFIAGRGTCCTETYLVVGPWRSERECRNVISYMKTKFFRFMVLQLKYTQNGTSQVYQLVPMQDFSKPWTDNELYEKYNLNADEIKFIESMIKPME